MIQQEKGSAMERFLDLARLFLASITLLTAALFPQVCPAQTQAQWVAKAVSVQGTVEARRLGDEQWLPVKLNDTFNPGDAIRVQDRSRADLALLDQSVLRLNAGTTMTVEAVKDTRTWVVDLLRGAAYFFSSGPRRLNVRTAFATAGVRGTEFFVEVDADKAVFTILEGTVAAENSAGSLTLTSGQSAVAEAGKAPALRAVVRPRDAVHWALYYPPAIYFSPEEFPPGPDWRGAVRQSIEQQRRGDLQKAFDAIASVPEAVPDPRFFAYRASLLLAVGRVDEAGADIERAVTLAPQNADARALQAVIAVVQGDKGKALASAQQAVRAAPASATAQIALSYAQQARFDLGGARESLKTAVKLDPQNALAWARLAELHSSFGELKQALEAAQKAVALEPDLSRTQTVLGYAYLTQVETKPAKQAFEKAIVLDQADPLPRMGLGLARIREGDLPGGSGDIEIAASLDPNNSLVRSYTGKTYFEQKRKGLDEREYGVAKELDPQDPTPEFYDAIAKQTTNRPVEALHDLQRAIELNDNRAVYRSRLLLDSDLAARSASLGRIYSDLGFQQLALTEGWKSVNVDPTNFSAHRFLADSYSALPRHEIARVSELLQSQLLQPVNLTPIQPRLAESNLFLISAGGPGALSSNEFNQLFTRNQLNLQASGLAGNHDTRGAELVVSGLHDQLAFSIGGFHFDTDGWRANADQQDTIANAFLQMDLSPDTGVQFEYRSRDIDTGDLQMSFFQDEVRDQFTTSAQTDTYRLGLRHGFSPRSIILGSLLYQDDQRRAHDTPDPVVSVDIAEPDTRAKGGELQHLFRSPRFSAVSGVGYYELDRRQLTTLDIADPIFPLTNVDDADTGVTHANVYLYTYLNVLRNVTLTLGASGDFFESDGDTLSTLSSAGFVLSTTSSTVSRSEDQFNPKLGLTWHPLPDTTIRAAAFRVLKRALIANQTLEPTQVAGFNQFYDDIEATDSWHYGVAADQKFSRTLFGGLAFSQRDLEVPIPFFDPFTSTTQIVSKDWREYLVRPYLFWTPHRWLALSAEYQYERFERTADNLNFGVQEATTQKVPLGLRFFHPSGLTLGAKATYVSQDGEFQPKGGTCCQPGDSSFWLVDAGLSYRLPKRYGFVGVGVTNLFDRGFQYQETDFNNPTILPSRTFFARLTLAFP
jgi:tetratricopeptide (TPR) repeat protein